MADYGVIDAHLRKATESLRYRGEDVDATLGDFWAWSASNLVSNATRGVLAEFIVATALGAADGVREEWAAWDLTSPTGIRVEVKSAAYIQSWNQKDLSKISFGVRRTRNWTSDAGMSKEEASRPAQVYVFALLTTLEQSVIDPLDLDQWEFYVLSTSVLNERRRSQHSITLPSLRRLTEPIVFDQLVQAIEDAARPRP